MIDLNITWPQTKQQIIELLEKYDIQPTQQRVLIAEILFARPQHLSAEHILENVNGAAGTVSKATVYNTLGLFAEKGLVHEVNVDPSRVFYDSNTQPHHHFFNTDTGVLSDIDPADIEITKFPPLPEGTSLSAVDVIVRVSEDSVSQAEENSDLVSREYPELE